MIFQSLNILAINMHRKVSNFKNSSVKNFITSFFISEKSNPLFYATLFFDGGKGAVFSDHHTTVIFYLPCSSPRCTCCQIYQLFKCFSDWYSLLDFKLSENNNHVVFIIVCYAMLGIMSCTSFIYDNIMLNGWMVLTI